MDQEYQVVYVRIPKTLWQALKARAKVEDRTFVSLVNRLLAQGMNTEIAPEELPKNHTRVHHVTT